MLVFKCVKPVINGAVLAGHNGIFWLELRLERTTLEEYLFPQKRYSYPPFLQTMYSLPEPLVPFGSEVPRFHTFLEVVILFDGLLCGI